MKKLSILNTAFISFISFPAFSMLDQSFDDNSNNHNIIVGVNARIFIGDITINNPIIEEIRPTNTVNVIQTCNSIKELSDKYKSIRNLGNASSSEEAIKYLLGRLHGRAWERLGNLLLVY